MPDFIEYMKRVYGPNYREHIQPTPKRHKSRIMTWLGFWPFSALWTLLNDPLRRLVEAIYDAVAGTLLKISNYVFRNALKDLTVVDAPPAKPTAPAGVSLVDVPVDETVFTNKGQ
jgi:hypothetical protein